MMDILRNLGIGGLALLVCYYLIRDVLGPLVKKALGKNNGNPNDRVMVLEVNFATLSTKVADLRELMNLHQASMNSKLDLVLKEVRQIREVLTERIAKAETHIEHLLKGRL